MIYLISNVTYSRSAKLTPAPEDLLVFLNRAVSYAWYEDHSRKLIIRRMPGKEYGAPISGADIRYIFNDNKPDAMPAELLAKVDAGYP